jgi:glycosyltransferase involved in cell wall biosynthesis
VEAKISAVMLDNGEPTLARSVESVARQTAGVDEIILVTGPKTDWRAVEELSYKYQLRVIGPVGRIGYGRYLGILKASGDVVMSCDSDTIYSEDYLEHALGDINRGFQLVKAGVVYPLDASNPLWIVDHMVFLITGAYEFGWVFRRGEMLSVITERDVKAFMNIPKIDLGRRPTSRLKSTINYNMKCWTRLPTFFTREYLPPAVAATTPVSAVLAVCALGTRA